AMPTPEGTSSAGSPWPSSTRTVNGAASIPSATRTRGVDMRRIGSLCSGIGGLELGLEWAGVGRTVWQVEHDASCREVLAMHWPEADRSVTDVVEAADILLPRVDVVCAGIPCQPFSQAGKPGSPTNDGSGPTSNASSP